MADGLFHKRKPLTKDDIRRLKETLPKKVEISSEGTKITEKTDEDDAAKAETASDVAPILENRSDEISVPLSAEEIRSFQIYASMLKEKNKVMNLTAVDDDEGIAMKHFIDSLTLCPYIREEEAKAGEGKQLTFIDVGTGAGFPGLPVKISCPELGVTLMDSLEKRLKFLDEVIAALGLQDCSTVHSRAEDAGRNKKYREKYDIATARAVARLSVLAEYCLPLVKVGGVFLAMKAHSEDEETEAGKAIALLGGTVEKTDTFKLPGTDMERTIIVVRKIRPTPARFPRKAGTPSKTPIV